MKKLILLMVVVSLIGCRETASESLEKQHEALKDSFNKELEADSIKLGINKY